MLKRWSLTQSLDIVGQLSLGVRYLDLRVAPDPLTSDPRCLHALYGASLKVVLQQAKSFIRDHPREVLLIDVNHVYTFSPEQHVSLLDNVVSTLGDLLVPRSDCLPSLEHLWTTSGRVLFFYESIPRKWEGPVWSSASCHSPWANTCNTESLLKFLTSSLHKPRPQGCLHVSQGVLTPDTAYLMGHMQSSLRDSLAQPFAPKFVKWVMNNVEQGNANLLNICLLDYVEMTRYVDVVLGCNQYKYFE